jgi:hypothetical protein
VIAVHIVLALFCVVWLAQSALFASNVRKMRSLVRVDPPEPDTWPRVSVVVPARDEAATIGPALRSRLADDYPDLEVVVVDDRSADETADVVRAIAAEDPRVRLVRVDELPERWLGKVHALWQGQQAATGEWLLFSDADVHVEPGTMRKAVAYCLAEGFDHMALVPEYGTASLAVRAVWAVFMRIFAIMVDVGKVRDPDRPKAAMGSGAFNLVRREAWERTEGFEWLRLETTDDMGVGVLMKRHGFRSDGLDGRGTASVVIYRELADFFAGTEKNVGMTLGVSDLVYYPGTVLWLALEWSPILALALGPPWLRVLGAVALVVASAVHVWALRFNTGRGAAGLLWPAGSALFAFTLVRARVLARRRGGIAWRDTLYSVEEILANRRFPP